MFMLLFLLKMILIFLLLRPFHFDLLGNVLGSACFVLVPFFWDSGAFGNYQLRLSAELGNPAS